MLNYWRRNIQSLQVKLVVIYVLLIIIGMQIIGLYFTNVLERDLTENFKSNIESQIDLIETRIVELDSEHENNRNKFQQEVQKVIDDYGNRSDINEIRYVNSDQILLATSKISNESTLNSRVNIKELNEALETGTQNDDIFVSKADDNKRMWIVNSPVIAHDKVIGSLYVASNIENVYSQLEKINNTFIIATAISLIITTVLGIFVARTITKPIISMRNQALLMSEGNYTSRVQIYSDDEIGQLAESFNILSKRVQEAQANTESEKNRLDSVITHMSDGIISSDRRGGIRLANDTALYMLDVKYEDILNKNMITELGLEDELELSDILDDRDTSHLIFLESKEGNRIVRVNFSAIVKDTGFVSGFIAVMHDVTEQEEFERERREFVANVSHELRTPLTSMHSYIEALEDGAWQDDEIAPRFLKVTREETERMSRLVEDLLQLSRMDSEVEEINKEVVNFNMFLENIIERFTVTFKDEVVFTKNIPNKPIYSEIAIDKMMQVLDNVITNAIKYQTRTPKKVEFHLQENTLYKRMTLRIKDHGLGIPGKNVNQIFDRFYRIDKSRTRQMGGTGLGLAISKEIVEAHDGKIWATSIEGEGTTIFINLPCLDIEEDEWDE
ncbi:MULTISPECIES: cell wall metabolism sensor histidine kinase WalK [unclassified Nosocomiicoccus]|uniref:cell wall metabolism sensor histidine kinase WalK n=1 Tax=unclassified Nosocomiicoccus TaxID=2646683 RepID=UPI0008A4BAE4|nr:MULTISPECIES: cell wall metabolism sensor histidine kinase WalK [unclassified Nosocomiicoccus]OFL47241.1 PAS domain-containing sensor histidine kinase [Nosocomiicoccus sp. HMSC067E10]OFO54096.1 PAS domain-containing sensor histidine kinase [Nosocomiicoccus sp. HMSC059G07]